MRRKVREQAGDKRKEVGDDTIVGKPSGPFKQGPKSLTEQAIFPSNARAPLMTQENVAFIRR